ncbi:HERC3 ligase, partial [Certhia familiaris]|nr:HERC3 ligase [Certhia familiaris]
FFCLFFNLLTCSCFSFFFIPSAFLSGSDRITGYELECFKFWIEDPQIENPDEFHPYASTCHLILFLPRYSSQKILKKRLLYAIEHNEGFGRA